MPPLDEIRAAFLRMPWRRFQNAQGSVIPPFAAMRNTTTTKLDGEIVHLCAQPSSTAQDWYLVNGPWAVGAVATNEGLCSPAFHASAYAQYDTADGTPAVGETWGPENGSWKLRSGVTGFLVVGAATTVGDYDVVPVVQHKAAGTRALTEWYNPATKDTALTGGRFSESDNATLYFAKRIGAADNGITHDPTVTNPITDGNFTVTQDGLYLISIYWRVEPDATTWGSGTNGNGAGARLALRRKPSGGAFGFLDNFNIWARASDSGELGTGAHISSSVTAQVNLDDGDVLHLLCSSLGAPSTLEWSVSEANFVYERLGAQSAAVSIP